MENLTQFYNKEYMEPNNKISKVKAQVNKSIKKSSATLACA